MPVTRRLAICATAATFTIFGTLRSAFAIGKINVATTGKGSAQNWPIHIARAKGFFTANGVEVELFSSPSTAAAVQLLAGGSVEIATGGISDAMHAIDQGSPITLVRIEARVPPYTLWAKPAIKSIKDLKRKLIIVGGAKDITRIYLEGMLAPNGLKAGDYDMIYAGTTVSRFAALMAGAVDAALLVPPFSFKAASNGFSKLGELTEYMPTMPFTGYAVQIDWANAHKPELIGFLNGVAKGVDFFYDPAMRKESIDILQKESGAERSDVEQTYDYYQRIKLFDRRGVVEAAQVATLATAMTALGDLVGSPDLARFANPAISKWAADVK
jgi:NitT/TauT family transport system substrate-binding protein